MAQMEVKTCTGCKCVQTIDKFYRCGRWYQSKCIPCHNDARKQYSRKPYQPRVKKPIGFDKLPFNTRCNIIKDIQDGKKYKQVSRDHNILYATLILWKKRDSIKITASKPIKEAKHIVHNSK